MKRFLIGLLKLFAKLVLSFGVYLASFYVFWQVYLVPPHDVVNLTWTAITMQAYFSILPIYFLTDYLVIKCIRFKRRIFYWLSTIVVMVLLIFTSMFLTKWSPAWGNLLLLQAYCMDQSFYLEKPLGYEERHKRACENYYNAIQNIF